MLIQMVRDKLTLSVDREVIKKAKKQRLNISYITEKFLRAYTLAEKTNGSLHDAYQQFFESIVPLLREFDCEVKIAEGIEAVPTWDDEGNEYEIERPLSILLMSDGSFYIDELDKHLKDIDKIAPRDFLGPQKILSNLVNTLVRTKEARKERMREILMAKNIVDAISKTIAEKHATIRNEKGARDLKMTPETATIEYRGKRYRKAKPEERNQKPKRRSH